MRNITSTQLSPIKGEGDYGKYYIMKIGIDCRLWNQTGVGRYIRNLVRELDERDTAHTFVLYLLDEEYKTLRFKNKKIEKRRANIAWHTVQEQILFPRIIAKDNLDLMHFTYYSVPILYRGPYVITLHDLIIYYFMTGEASTLPFPLYKAKHLAYKYLLSQMRKNAKKIIVPLEATGKDVIKLFPQVKDKIVVTKEGFDEGFTKGGTISENIQKITKKNYFLYVGNAYPHKNVTKLINAYLNLKTENKKIKGEHYNLVLVGKNDFFYTRLKTQFRDEHIIFLHNISDIDLATLYRNAQALVTPSLMEGFGLPVLEAMSLGCQVAASDIPAFREVCGDAAIFFNPNDTVDMEKTLIKILSLSHSDKEEYLKKGKKRAKSFSWSTMVDDTIQVYESCVES